MANLRDLARRLTAKSKVLPQEANALKIKVATAILKDLLYETPVDTSQALSNWQITLGAPDAHRITALSPGERGSTQAASASAALALGLKILESAKPGESIWIQNKLPYIRRLNDGYSTQTPAGFVERARLIGHKVAEQGL